MITHTSRTERLLLIGILVGVVALLQIHAIAFWMNHVGKIGWAWSIMLEVVALWLWYQPRVARQLLGLLASSLVLLGPIHHVSSPLIEEVWVAPHRDDSRTVQIEALQREHERVQLNLTTYRANSETRAGWLPSIERAEARLSEIDRQLATLQSQPPEAGLAWRDKAVIVMQALALLLFQITAVFTIRALGQISRRADAAQEAIRIPEAEETKAPPSDPHPAQELEPETQGELEAPEKATDEGRDDMAVGGFDLARIRELRSQWHAFLEETGISQRGFASKHGINSRDLSFLRAHEERAAAGERTISIQALIKLENVLATETGRRLRAVSGSDLR